MLKHSELIWFMVQEKSISSLLSWILQSFINAFENQTKVDGQNIEKFASNRVSYS